MLFKKVNISYTVLSGCPNFLYYVSELFFCSILKKISDASEEFILSEIVEHVFIINLQKMTQ